MRDEDAWWEPPSMSLIRVIVAVAAVFVSAGCGGLTSPDDSAARSFNFAAGPQEWIAGFADYPAGQEAFMELDSAYKPLAAELGSGRWALFISGNNHSDDLFMFFKRRLSGLKPATTYSATFAVEIATNVPRGCGGAGGSPGASVYLKAGSSTAEPRVVPDGLGTLRLTIDKGNQATGGSNAVVLGNIENSLPCTAENDVARKWELKQLSSRSNAINVETDSDGGLWLLMGTDSGFEATTSLYYTTFHVTLVVNR
jgi:hypothetical protein